MATREQIELNAREYRMLPELAKRLEQLEAEAAMLHPFAGTPKGSEVAIGISALAHAELDHLDVSGHHVDLLADAHNTIEPARRPASLT